MHARYYSGSMGRFLSVDPKVRRTSMRQSGRWNRYAYALASPMIYTDPDGLDVIYGHPADKKFFEKAANRNQRVKAVLDAFAPGTGRDLIIQRGDPGAHPMTGVPRAAVTDSTWAPPVADDALRNAMDQAYNAAGGGKAGEAAAEAVFEASYTLETETITITHQTTGREKLHELGHVEQDLLHPVQSRIDAEAAKQAPTDEAYKNSAAEQYAERFAEDAEKKNPPH